MKDITAGDVVETLYYDPAGQYYAPASGSFGVEEDSSPSKCYTDGQFKIAGARPATTPGDWTVTVRVNNVNKYTATFTIQDASALPPPAPGVNLAVNQVLAANCPRISLVVTVTDSQGKPMGGLGASNFALLEDGAAQSVQAFAGSGLSAVTVALVLDRSSSAAGSAPLADQKNAAKSFITQLGSADQVAIFAFDTTVNLVRDYTNDRAALNAAIDSVQAGGSSSLYAAIVQAAQSLAARAGRKAVVIMAGAPNAGTASEQDALSQARLAGTPVFPVEFGAQDDSLDRIAKATGGAYSKAANSSGLGAVLLTLGQTIAGQYEVVYTTAAPGASHNLQLTATVGTVTSSAAASTLAACLVPTGVVTLAMQGATGTAGSAVDIPVNLTATSSVPTTFQFDVTFDPAKLKFNQGRKGEQMTASGRDVTISSPFANLIHVTSAGATLGPIGNGAVAYLNFSLTASFNGGGSTLSCSNAASADLRGQPIPTDCGSATVTSTPTNLPQITDVLHGTTFQAGFAAGGWVAIKGTGFGSGTRIWGASDFSGGRLPANLDGIGVKIDGFPAYVYYISPTQLNVLAPMDVTDKDVSVQVITPQGSSNIFPSRRSRLAPGFFMYEPEGRRYVIGVHQDGSLVGKASLYNPPATTPARPGETILVYGTGFGQTTPPGVDGALPTVAPLAIPANITLGGRPVQVAAALVAAGQYQFNIQIPADMPDGEYALVAETGGALSPANALVAVQR